LKLEQQNGKSLQLQASSKQPTSSKEKPSPNDGGSKMQPTSKHLKSVEQVSAFHEVLKIGQKSKAETYGD